jgi:glycosyltransferase involved in cell wall biosynthesis
MKIGIYVDVAKDEKPSGIGLHIRNLLQALAGIDQENEYLLYFQHDVLGRRKEFLHRPLQPNFRSRPLRFPAGWQGEHPSLWWDRYLLLILRADGVDVFHGPNHILPAFKPSSSIVTIHDLAYFKIDNLYEDTFNAYLKQLTLTALARSAAVIALSENTRRDVESLGVPPERIRVIYGGAHVTPAAEIRVEREEELRRTLGLPERYVLFVGSLGPRKNVPFLLRAFAELKKRDDDPRGLVLVGHRSSASEEIESLIQSLGIESDVVITGYVEDWQLPLIYRMADLFVLPTLYEGFTLVTLEALAYGIPVVATDVSSIREGVGDAALLVEVDNVEALAGAMRRVRDDREVREQLVARGKIQAQKFTWHRCAQETLSIYEDVYQKFRGGER